jgi:hypothetical protein
MRIYASSSGQPSHACPKNDKGQWASTTIGPVTNTSPESGFGLWGRDARSAKR